MTEEVRSEVRVRLAHAGDVPAIARTYVDTWRSAYAGLLPDRVLTGMSETRQHAYWGETLARGADTIHVAEVAGAVAGFAAAGAARALLPKTANLVCRGEVYTLYVRPEHQEFGLGRALLVASFGALVRRGMLPVVIWVLADNPARFFYEHLGGRRVGERQSSLGGAHHNEAAYLWTDIPCSGSARWSI
ncbi:MAG: GNAT family N-acetyltransferase [Alphaproteobacteria bacterium]